jgi:hypothetical protein
LLDATVPTGVNLPPLTPANSSIISSFVFGTTQYGSQGWYFTIGSPIGVTSTDSSTFWFEAQNDLEGPGAGGGLGSLFAGYGDGNSLDPAGNWVMQSSTAASVQGTPDAASTAELFAGALTALGVCRSFLGRRAAPQR